MSTAQPQNLALFNGYRAPHPSVLTIRPRGVFGDKIIEILGADGLPLLACKGFAFSKKKEFSSVTGQFLCTLHRHSFDRQRMFTLDARDGTTLLRIHRQFSLGSRKLDAYFRNVAAEAINQEVMLEIRFHGLSRREAAVTWNGVNVVTVQRTGALSRSWRVDVAQGVDQALAAMLSVMLVVVYREQQAAANSASGAGA